MRAHRAGLTALILLCAAPVWAADPVAGTEPIKGSDAMSDKGRSGPDGWSWAPQTRDQAPTDKDAASGSQALNSKPGPNTAKNLKPGDDPGTPVSTQSHGPGTIDAGSARRP